MARRRQKGSHWKTTNHGWLGRKAGPRKMKIDINEMSEKLARDPSISDYDFWRTLKNLNNEIFHIANNNDPIPMELIRWRAVLNKARSKRKIR
jgi:hypothetical protein